MGTRVHHGRTQAGFTLCDLDLIFKVTGVTFTKMVSAQYLKNCWALCILTCHGQRLHVGANEQKPYFAKVTPVTLKMGSRSQRANLTSVLPWCICVPSLVILGEIFFEIICGNSFCKSDPCDLEIGVKVTQSELYLSNLCPSMVHLCTHFGDPRSNISGDIELKQFFCKIDPCDLENGVKVMQSKLELCPFMVHLCTKFGYPRSNIS